MGHGRTDEFRKDAVLIALSSKDQKMIRGIIFPEDGLTRKQVSDDFGVGMPTLNKWITAHPLPSNGLPSHGLQGKP